MDVLGVQQMKIRKHNNYYKRCKKDVKVVYISSPVKFKTCASKFRALVQELTGKDSDADAAAHRFSDINGADDQNSPKVVVDQGLACAVSGDDHQQGDLRSSPSMEDQFDDLFLPHREGSFLGMFTSSLFHHDFNFQQDLAL